MHRHQVDEHNFAVASHQKKHFCEIDKSFCKNEFNTSCKHENHINIPSEKCFSCQFHFEKNYDAATFYSTPIVEFQLKKVLIADVNLATFFTKRISNKGPPELG